MSNPETITTARLLVLDKQKRLIGAIRPLDSKQRPGDFDFIGGRIDEGEDPLLGVGREFHEETGIEIDLAEVEPLHEEIDEDGDKRIIRLYYLYNKLTSVDEIKIMPEHIGAVCVSQNTALNLTEFPAHQRAISRLDQLVVA